MTVQIPGIGSFFILKIKGLWEENYDSHNRNIHNLFFMC